MLESFMRVDLHDLPHDIALLHGLVRDLVGEIESKETRLCEAEAETERLRLLLKQLQRLQFGRRSEQVDPDQFELGIDDLGADIGRAEAGSSAPEAEPSEAPDSTKPGRNLPEHLPREELILETENVCPGCGGALHLVGESVSEMLDWVPAQLKVIRIRRPKHGCRTCGTIHQAPAPERLIAKGMATAGLIANVLVAKYCDHLPLYRQAQMFARHGVEIDRSTLANWVGGACWWLESLHERLAAHVFASAEIFADDTPIPVLDPGRRRTKTGRLWVYAREQRGWDGPDPPAAVYFYSPDRKGERPAAHLRGFRGTLQVDGYAGFERLTASGHVVLAACWAHARRKFYELHEAIGSPIAAEALRRISELYAIEARIRGQSSEVRLRIRRAQSKPLIDRMKRWLDQELTRIPSRGRLAEAIRYALLRWESLCRFLDNGRVELDTNPVERAIRPVALGRKNHLFAGSDGGGERWAVVCSLIETAKLNHVEPYAYLKDILQRLADGFPRKHIDDLLPWNWRPLEPVKA